MALFLGLRAQCALGLKISVRKPSCLVGAAMSSSRRAFAQAEASPSVRNLAGGWQAIYSAEHAREYYWNTQSGATTWERPDLPPVTSEASESSTETPGARRRRGSRGGRSRRLAPGTPGHQLVSLLSSALEQPISKDDFVFKTESFGGLYRCTLTLAKLENLEFQGAAYSSAAASDNALILAACHVKQKFNLKEETTEAPATSARRGRPGQAGRPGQDYGSRNPKTLLASLVQYALGCDLRHGDIPYTNRALGGGTIESTVSLQMLKETGPKEFKATAPLGKDAEMAAAKAAFQELEAKLTAAGDARKAKVLDIPPASDGSPKGRLKQLVRYAFGAHYNKGDIEYSCQELGETAECIVTLPVLKDMEPREFKASAGSVKDAEVAAALAAYQALEPTLMAKAGARMAEKRAA